MLEYTCAVQAFKVTWETTFCGFPFTCMSLVFLFVQLYNIMRSYSPSNDVKVYSIMYIIYGLICTYDSEAVLEIIIVQQGQIK